MSPPSVQLSPRLLRCQTVKLGLASPARSPQLSPACFALLCFSSLDAYRHNPLLLTLLPPVSPPFFILISLQLGYRGRLFNGLNKSNPHQEMASPIALRRGSSPSPGRSPQPPPPHPSIASAASKRAGSFTTTVDEAHLQRVTTTSSVNINTASDDAPIHPTLLQPRVAVVLNVPPPWHPWLFTLRLVSVLPAAWWGLPSLLQLLIRLLPNQDFVLVSKSGLEDDATKELYSLTETGLATIWVSQALGCNKKKGGRS